MDSGTEPNVVRHGELLLVGMVTRAGYSDIGALWQAFTPVEASVPAAVPGRAYELHVYPEGYACGEPFWLMVGVAVERLEHLPPALFAKPLPAAAYAVFEHRLGDGGFEGANESIEAWSRSSAYERCAPLTVRRVRPPSTARRRRTTPGLGAAPSLFAGPTCPGWGS